MVSPRKLKSRYFNSCYGKFRHPHWGLALDHYKRLHDQQPKAHFQIYACDFCAGLHIGHRKTSWRELRETDYLIPEEVESVGP